MIETATSERVVVSEAFLLCLCSRSSDNCCGDLCNKQNRETDRRLHYSHGAAQCNQRNYVASCVLPKLYLSVDLYLAYPSL